MVGGLVEEQEVGALQEELGQHHTHLPSAAELGHGAPEIVVPKTEAQQHLLGLLLSAVGTHHGQLLSHLAVAVEELLIVRRGVVLALGNLLLHARQFFLHGLYPVEGREGLVEHRALAVGHHLLRQIAYRLARGDDHRARLGLLESGEDFEQRRLTGAVLAHEAYAVTVGDIESDIVEKVGACKLDREIIDC